MASPDEKRRIESHLNSCPACRQTRAWMQATRQVIAARPFAEPPFDMRARIARAIAEANPNPVPISARPAPRRPFVLRPAFTAAMTLAMVGVIGVGVYQLVETPRPQSPASVAVVRPKMPRVASNVPAVKTPPNAAIKPAPSVAVKKTGSSILTAQVRKSPLETLEPPLLVAPPTRRGVETVKSVAPSVKPGISSGVKTALKGNNKTNLTPLKSLTPTAPPEKIASNPKPSAPETTVLPVDPTPAPETTPAPEPSAPVKVAQRDLSSEIRLRLTAQQGSRPTARTVAAAYQSPLRSAAFSSSELDSGTRNPGSGTADIVHTPGF